MGHLVYADVRWISAVHWQHGPGISCSLEAMEARKLRRRLDKMARDRGRLYTGKEKEEREWKSYSNYLTAALCAPKQLCSSCGHQQLFSHSYTNRHACMGTPDRMQCTYSPANVSPARKKFKRMLIVLLNRQQHFKTYRPQLDAWLSPICDCSTLIHGRVATRFVR